ncbi:MAG: DUF3800 domain-containing protein [Opitutaceae bacterium]|nr:DUF3800 domain-containing protein [Opitutaceae bacterium]
MPQVFNLYTDESCHLEHDHQSVMVLGVVWCLQEKARETAVRIREIKVAHGLPPDFEMKWSKVSPAKQDFYLTVLNYFFDDDDVHFRAWVAHKAGLRHADFGQSHDDWYYKMMFGFFEPLLTPDARFRLYLDKKDTRSSRKVAKLHEVLCNNLYDFDRQIVERVQVVESHAVEQLQLADLLLGAVGYVNRDLNQSLAKNALVARIRERTGYSLLRPTLLKEENSGISFPKARRRPTGSLKCGAASASAGHDPRWRLFPTEIPTRPIESFGGKMNVEEKSDTCWHYLISAIS